MNTQDRILAGEGENTLYVRLTGRGHFQNSHPLKELLLKRIESGKAAIVIDLKECCSMDSTFMGVLAGVAIKLKKMHLPVLRLVNVSPHNFDLLDTLGVVHLLEVSELSPKDQPEAVPLEGEIPAKEKIAEHMLEAHQTLSDLSEMNQVKFKNVIEFLQQDLGKTKE